MISTYGLKEHWIPENKDLEDEEWHQLPKSNIYLSPDFLPNYEGEKRDKALILIQGTGAVRAG